MVRQPYVDSNGMKKGAWSKDEDDILSAHVERFGHPNWRLLPVLAGLARCGKSCRLRWMNYLKPGLKHGMFTKQEEDLIIRLHTQLGNKWSAIAAELPGRTDNDIKNYWHAHISKRGKPQEEQSSSSSEIDCRITENHDQQNPSSDEVFSTESDVACSFAESYEQTCFAQFDIDPSPFLEEQMLHHDVSAFSDSSSSDGVITCWNSAESEGNNFWSEPLEEDTYDIVLW